jgi:hypothetical protein
MDKYELQYWKSKLDDIWLERVSMIHKGKDLDLAIEYSFIHLLSDETRLLNSDTSDFKRLVNSFLINQKPQKLRKKLL